MMISTAMPATVRLDEIVDALEIQFDESSSFLDLDTGEVETVSRDLLRAIHGAGVFRYFKDTLRRHNIETAWFAFRGEALRKIAVEWCEENHVIWK
jgi:hypothetical protein